MSDAILVLNAGSSSIKFSLFLARDGALDLFLGGQLEGLYTESHFIARDAAGVVLGGAVTFSFDPLGRPVNVNKAALAAATTITVTGQPNIVVQPESGWVQ